MRERSAQLRSNAQAVLALLGGALGLLGLLGVLLAPLFLSGGDGFVGGIAILYFGVHALGGSMILAIGLLIPQAPHRGIHLSTWERRFVVWGVIGPIMSVTSYFVGITLVPPISPGIHSILVALLVVMTLSGPIAVIAAILSNRRGEVSTLLPRIDRGY